MSPVLGLLACDEIWEPLCTRHGDYPDMYSALLAEAGARFELKRYAVAEGEFPTTATECDAWLISGSRASVYESLFWMAPALQLVRDIHAAGVPQVGVCFGHQLIAEALGGKVGRATVGWGHGAIEINVTATPDASPPPTSPLRLFMCHQDQVLALPPGAVRLASAAHCPNAMFVLGADALGIQAHPEFSEAFMREMSLEEGSTLPLAVREHALKTLHLPIDRQPIGRWMAQFLKLLPT